MSEEQQLPDDSKTPGQLLKAARELRGYQQTGVAERLCVSVQTIVDIENDDYQHFTAEIYLRGHMRSYARLCNIDPLIVLKAYEALGIDIQSDRQVPVILAQDVLISRPVRRAKYRALLWAGLGVLLMLIVMVLLWWQEQSRHFYYTQKVTVPVETKSTAVVKPAVEKMSSLLSRQKVATTRALHFVKQIQHKEKMQGATTW